MLMTAKQMVKFLKKHGFKKIRQKGSHQFFKNEETGKMTTIPMHNGDLDKGTEDAILKQAGLK
ncbi:HicA toxin [Streptococcus suis]|uniref:HicA toxin n=1 Tax=Streptococcus suis TaxID=1307 RepID=A0A116LFK4_STRSU|nr:type II toxin-antitoxin system HicA family toxin [Streptococcus suis]NQH39969.1 type II toxin-antitoxin system HicA family toxin [Streptococcus suis]CYU89822.1 HicA toxin [Streptococcus suis]